MSCSLFHRTRWTLVYRTRGHGDEARAALSELCAIYYEPVHAFVRHWSRNEGEARDLTHFFFADLLSRESLGEVDVSRGRFRSYLVGAAKHFLLKHRSGERAGKRGGGVNHVELPEDLASSDEVDLAFDRNWALALINRAVAALEGEMSAAGKGRQFEVLKPWLDGGAAGSLEVAGSELGLNANALNVAIHRFRQRFLRIVRAEVESTTVNAEDAADEFRHLVDVLAKG